MSFEQNKVVKLQVPVQSFLADLPWRLAVRFFFLAEEIARVQVTDFLGYFLHRII